MDKISFTRSNDHNFGVSLYSGCSPSTTVFVHVRLLARSWGLYDTIDEQTPSDPPIERVGEYFSMNSV